MNRMTMAGSPSSVLLNRIAQGYMDWRSSLGAEMVTNGAFTGAATGWTLGSGWTYGTNAVDRDGGGTATMTQATCIPVAGGIYKVTYTISAYTDGNVTVSIGGTSGTARSSAATFTEYIKAGDATVLTFTPAADSTFTIDDVSVKNVGVLTADGVAMWVDDRGATAGKGALHMSTEDGTSHVFGDRVGIGTLYPSVFFEVNGLAQFASNIQFGASALGIATASIDAATMLLIARNAAAQTQTVAQITGNATVANSTFDIVKGRLTGSLTLNANGTLEIADATNLLSKVYGRYWQGANGEVMNTYNIVGFEFSHRLMIGATGAPAQRATTVPTNDIQIFDGTAPVGTLANGINIYSASGECYIMDAAGNATLQSPHDKKTGEWIFYSKHTPTGRVLRIDMERLMRRLDEEFGGGFLTEYMEEVHA